MAGTFESERQAPEQRERSTAATSDLRRRVQRAADDRQLAPVLASGWRGWRERQKESAPKQDRTADLGIASARRSRSYLSAA